MKLIDIIDSVEKSILIEQWCDGIIFFGHSAFHRGEGLVDFDKGDGKIEEFDDSLFFYLYGHEDEPATVLSLLEDIRVEGEKVFLKDQEGNSIYLICYHGKPVDFTKK